MNRTLFFVSCAAVCGLSLCAGAKNTSGWVYLDNGIVRIGVDKSRGACVGYFGESKTGRNLLNHYDEGRFVQQSYYGAPDGSMWNKQPWSYNPVQGGSWDGKPSRMLEFQNKADSLYAKIEPRNWSGGAPCPEAIMEETITLTASVARIAFKMTYTGEDQRNPRRQEMPAVFVDAVLSNLVYVSDHKLIRRVPGWPNENGRASESWIAYLDETDWGIGIFTPGTTDFTCYCFGAGAVGPDVSPCAYIAPVREFSLTKGLVTEYDVFLTIGTFEDIQKRFEDLKNGYQK